MPDHSTLGVNRFGRASDVAEQLKHPIVRVSAMDAALARIRTAPDFYPAVRFKTRVRVFFKLGPHHIAVWTRFQPLVEAARKDRKHIFAAARLYVEIEYRKEVEARRQSAELWGKCRKAPMGLHILSEVRLVLRWMRRCAPDAYAGVRDAILEPELFQAAE